VGWTIRDHSGDADDDLADDVDSEWAYAPDGSVAQETVGRIGTRPAEPRMDGSWTNSARS
jgi:hypothetical protein